MSTDLTPMMRQYLDIKEKHKDAILFFRLGDFYEMFFDDAIEATRILHITLTSRGNSKGNKIPMCGIPYHAADNYIARIIKQGKKVAICEQVEEPVPGKGIVKREVTKIITPGTFIADDILDESVNNYILSLNKRGENFGLAYADISTGEFRVTEIDNREDLFSELYKISPSECLVSEKFVNDSDFKHFSDINLGTITVNEDWMFDSELSKREITEHFLVESFEGFGCEEMDLAISSAGALLRYLKNTQKSKLQNIDVISTYNAAQYMSMDRNTHRHLELIQNQEDLSSKNTLFEVLDITETPMGKRLLKRWILNPLVDMKDIRERLNVVEFFYDNVQIRKKVRECLSDIYDMERLANKISLGTANGRDMAALSFSLKGMAVLKEIIKDGLPERLDNIVSKLDEFEDIISWIDDCIIENPPNTIKEGGIIRGGYSKEVDELRYLVAGGKDWLADLQKKEVERTGISSLKVGFNKVFGYYIEVTKANLDAVPEDYMRKQTLVNAERFITSELKEQESKIIGSQDRIKDVEYEIFCVVREKVGAQIERLKRNAEYIAEIDVLSNFSEAAARNKYVCPKINDGDVMCIKEGRHPVLEKILKDKEFVPNDVCMDSTEEKIFIITGSNMAGKSTFIRQVALITVMAQMGSFVPVKKAEIGIVDRIFTRVGASDRLYRGMSTFMVEMLETANILNNATNRSLIILDEVGRGTSTFDGVSIAWSVVEYVNESIPEAKVMFATHYHELTELTRLMKGVKNYHLSVQEWGEEIAFLYKVVEGSCDESFGIHVAKLAGMPSKVVKRAREILEKLQKDSFFGNIRSRFSEETKKPDEQMDFFEKVPEKDPVIEEIENIDIDKITPLEALEKLAEFRNRIKR